MLPKPGSLEQSVTRKMSSLVLSGSKDQNVYALLARISEDLVM